MRRISVIARAAVERIVDELTNRRGLRQEWDNIDEEIAEEIKSAWREIIVEEIMEPEGGD